MEKIFVETWRKAEIVLKASYIPETPIHDIVLDMVISNGNKTLTVPGFWNGGTEWVLRFALPEAGTWEYTTICKEDDALNNIKGTVECTLYSGNLDIYKHGFVKTEANKKYFMYKINIFYFN